MEAFTNAVNAVNDIIWSAAVIVLLMGVAIYLTLGSRGIQFRYFKSMFKLLGEKGEAEEEQSINAFQALATTVGSRVGTGNIAGVATAIFFGGPGAIVWMWITALLGASTGIVECILGQAYKDRSGDNMVGGPAYYMTRGLKAKPLAILFVIATFIGPGFLLAAVQTYTSASSIHAAFNIPTVVVGGMLTAITGFVIIGGIKRIGQVAELLAPLMCGIYLLIAIYIIIRNIGSVPAVFASMFRCAFTRDAVYGSIMGTMVRWGIRRGFFSNDAGNGMAPIMASTARTSHPVKQGLVQGLSVYIDTILVCTITGISILLTDAYNVSANGIDDSSLLFEGAKGIEYGILFMQEAMTRAMGSAGGTILSVIITVFCFTTLLAYSYELESSVRFIWGDNKRAVSIIHIVFLAFCFFGSFVNGAVIWPMGDTGVGLMTWFNVAAIIFLSPRVFRIIKDYDKQIKAGLDPIFDPKTVGIEDPNGVWNDYVMKKKARGDYENDELGYYK